MIDNIKITSLNDIGSNLAANTIFPVVNTAVPVTNKANLQIIGNLILNGAGGSNFVQAAQATLAQSVVNSAQPNITSVGTLSISTLKISGGTSGYILRTDGLGNLSWIAPAATVSGSNSQVQFNNAGSFGSSANFTYDNSNNILNVIRANASYLTAYESVSTANLSANGLATIARINVTDTANLGAVDNVTITGGSNGQVLTTNGNGVLSWKNDANSSYDNSNVVSLLADFGSNTIVTTGNVTANYFNGVATDVLVEAVNNNYSYHMAFVTGAGDTTLHMDNDDNLQYNPADGTLTATRVDATYVLADLQYSNGYPAANVTGLGNIATINLTGSNANVLYGNGVFAAVAGGANTGNVTFDNITVQGDNNGLNLSAGSDFTANLAFLQVRAGDVASHIHLDTGNNQAYDLIVGDDQNYVQVSSTGNILLSAYDSNTNQYTWTLDYNGNFILAGGNSVIQSIANSSLDPLNPNVSTMTLTPDANYNSQVLVLDPTGPGHIHLRAHAFSNIDDPAANIFLGGENTAFEITQGANNVARIHSGGNIWTYGNDGKLTFPGTPRIDTDANNFEVQAAEAINFEANTVVNIYTDTGNTAYQWQFGDDGNLKLPGNTFAINYANGTQASAPLVDVLNTNGLTTVYYPTFVEDRTDGQIVRADVDLTYTTDTNTLTVGNISTIGNITANNFVGNGGSLSNVATSTTGNWTLAPGVNTVSLSVPLNGTYSIWVRGNIPNGIVTYTATAVVTNNNVPVLGSSYGWYYEDGNALVLTSIPTQFVGTVNNISNASISTTTANVFTFGITNNSGNAAVVNWGYTKL